MNGSNNLSWLVWKDYRQNRPIVVMALSLVLTPYAVLGYAICGGWPFYGDLAIDRSRWTFNSITACLYGLLFSEAAGLDRRKPDRRRTG